MIHIITYKPAYRDDFIYLNRQWIETYFRIEPSDLDTFSHVEDIVKNGGQIFLALNGDDRVVGCCALKHHVKDDTYELAKMAVSPEYRGRHIGHELLRTLWAYAQAHGVRRIFLEGNTQLEASIALYRSMGFYEKPLQGKAYDRCDILMEWTDALVRG